MLLLGKDSTGFPSFFVTVGEKHTNMDGNWFLLPGNVDQLAFGWGVEKLATIQTGCEETRIET